MKKKMYATSVIFQLSDIVKEFIGKVTDLGYSPDSRTLIVTPYNGYYGIYIESKENTTSGSIIHAFTADITLDSTKYVYGYEMLLGDIREV